jgi:3-oxoacyl-[acyl-carrier-protein] synthase-3
MIGIKRIGSYLPTSSANNLELLDKFNVTKDFLDSKIGVVSRSIVTDGEGTIDLCMGAIKNLCADNEIDLKKISALVVVTQNPDYSLPHTSAILHGRLGLQEGCACFDISLGCSGFVYGLSILESFMCTNDIKDGLLITADPYSKIVDLEDRNTLLLFGDAATATWVGSTPELVSIGFDYTTKGSDFDALICRNGKLVMDGRKVFNYVMKTVPGEIKKLLNKHEITVESVDSFIFHQGSKYILDSLTAELKLSKNKVAFGLLNYGNTVSSSIPLLLKDRLLDVNLKTFLLSGFGVGMSSASVILRRP